MRPHSSKALVSAILAALAALAAAAIAALGLADGHPPSSDPPSPGSTTKRSGFPPLSLDGPATVWAVGDGADGSTAAKRVAAMIEDRNPDRFLYLGDVYDYGTASQFDLNYAPVYGRFDAIAAPAPGNHEWENRDEGYYPYWEEATGEPIPPWYSFRIGKWQVLSLNSEAPHGSSSEQLHWLRRQLSDTSERGNCRIAFWHRPRYSAGAHGDAADIQPFWNLLEHRARIVLAGHDHSMQRLKSRRGIVEFVAGSGGHDATGVDDDDGRLAFAAEYVDGALRLRLRSRRASVAFVAADGDVLQARDLHCRRDR